MSSVGEIVEYGPPFTLLVRNESDKKITKRVGKFASMVLSNKNQAQFLFEASQKHYFGIDRDKIKDQLYYDLRRVIKHVPLLKKFEHADERMKN